jgi:hypothetical protein
VNARPLHTEGDETPEDQIRVLREFQISIGRMAGPNEAAMAREILRLRDLLVRCRGAVKHKKTGHDKRLQAVIAKGLSQDVCEYHKQALAMYSNLLDEIEQVQRTHQPNR